MDSNHSSDITELLHAANRGEGQALDRLLRLVYSELKRVARHHLRTSVGSPTLCTTELVHEAFMKMTRGAELDWQCRAHFFGIASRAMRQVLVDFARRRGASKRGGRWRRTTFSDQHATLDAQLDEILALDEALERLGDIEPRLRHVVEHRFFGGLSGDDIANLLGVSSRTIERDWIKARLILLQELNPREEQPSYAKSEVS